MHLLATAALAAGISLLGGAAPPAATAPGPSAPSPSDAQLEAAIADWFTKGGDKRVLALQTDFEAIAKAAGAIDIPAVKISCTTLKTDVDKAQAYAPLPDALAQKSWAASLDLYEMAALDCVSGADKVNADLLLKSNDEMLQGSKELGKATERIEAILN